MHAKFTQTSTSYVCAYNNGQPQNFIRFSNFLVFSLKIAINFFLHLSLFCHLREEEEVSSYWMTLGKREDTGNLQRKN
jgi:hypothetical protein